MKSSKKEHIAILLIGSNEGNLKKNLNFAIEQIDSLGHIESISSIYGSEAWGFSSQDFQNQAIKIATLLTPQNLLKATQQIEKKAGRKPKTKSGYEARILDIDIIFYDNSTLNTGELIIPHPHMQERRFVLEPLNEIIPDYTHPVMHKNICALLMECTDKGKVWKIEI